MLSGGSHFERKRDHAVGPRQTVTEACWLVPASTCDPQVHCSLQSAVSRQLTRQTQPVWSSAHDEPDGQSLLLPQELVQSEPGKLGPAWQRPRSHSVLSMHGPPTRVLSLPAVPGGRSSPHPSPKTSTGNSIERKNQGLIAVGR